MVMGGIIGVGIFFTPSEVAARAFEPWAFLSMWAIGGGFAVAAALTFGEWGASFPKAGGWYVFLLESWGGLAAFLFGWVVLFVVSTGAIASVALFAAGALDDGLRGTDLAEHRPAVAAGLIILVTLVCLAGVKAGTVFQSGMMLVKLTAIGVLIFAGLALALPMEPLPAVAVAAAPTDGLASGMLAALLPVFYAYGGWQMVCYVAPLVERPERTLPRAIVGGVLGVVVVYIALAFAYERVLGLPRMAADIGFASTLGVHVFGERGGAILSLGLAVSALGWMVVTIFGSPWLYVAMAREGLFIKRFGALSSRGVPALGLVLQMGLALLYLMLPLSVLVDSVVSAEWVFHGLVAVGLLRYRHQNPTAARPFTSPLYPLAPVLYLLAAIATVGTEAVHGDPAAKLIGLGILVVGALVYWARARWMGESDPERDDGMRT